MDMSSAKTLLNICAPKLQEWENIAWGQMSDAVLSVYVTGIYPLVPYLSCCIYCGLRAGVWRLGSSCPVEMIFVSQLLAPKSISFTPLKIHHSEKQAPQVIDV